MCFFLTGLSPDHTNGLNGYCCTIFQQTENTGTKIFGPPGTCDFFINARYIISFRMFTFSYFDFEDARYEKNARILRGLNWSEIEKIVEKDYRPLK